MRIHVHLYSCKVDSISDKKAMSHSHVVWPRVKNVWGQTANQSITVLYTWNTQQRSSMQEVDQ